MTSLADALAEGPIVLDGGLGTLLEQRGHDLGSSLWSARMLLERPEAVRSAHREYFSAGARVGISASYQVAFETLAAAGVDADGVDDLLRLSVRLVAEARDETGVDGWVAASIGPYGATLADGSEYRGDYGLSVTGLRTWHRRRLEVLAASGADLLAVETIPSVAEVEAIALELAGAGTPAWLCVTSVGGTMRSGEPLADAFTIAADVDEIVAIGINCTDPVELLETIRVARRVTGKPVVVYPNSGERWDASTRTWHGTADFSAGMVQDWLDAGAALVGGCCRVGPDQIAGIAAAVASHSHRD